MNSKRYFRTVSITCMFWIVVDSLGIKEYHSGSNVPFEIIVDTQMLLINYNPRYEICKFLRCIVK